MRCDTSSGIRKGLVGKVGGGAVTGLTEELVLALLFFF
jgi:hypothetical protein